MLKAFNKLQSKTIFSYKYVGPDTSQEGNTYQAGDGQGWPVGLAHEEPPQDHLVEGSI